MEGVRDAAGFRGELRHSVNTHTRAQTRTNTHAHTPPLVPQALLPFATVASRSPVRTTFPVWVLEEDVLEQGPQLTSSDHVA